MASEPATSQSGESAVALPDQPTVNLQIVSPSVGVNHPLQFPGIAASTTIKQLKGKIREALTVLAPADDDQRMIYRGRALVRDTDSLQDIFGLDALQDHQTIHLVIKDSGDSRIPAPSIRASVRGQSPANRPTSATRQHVPHPQQAAQPGQPQFGPQPPPPWARRSPFQGANPFPQPRMPSPSPTAYMTPDQIAAFQHQQQNMANWLTHLQREAMTRALVNQNQRGRAQVGMRGIGDQAGHLGGQPAEAGSRQGSPAPGYPAHRDPMVSHGLSPADLQNLIRGADAQQATQTITNAMQRSASGASLHNRPLTQPGVTTPIYPTVRAGSRPPSGRATPVPGSRSTSVAPTTHQPSLQPQHGVEVYILSSPEGPRGILVNGSVSDMHFTPRLQTQAPAQPQIHVPQPRQAQAEQQPQPAGGAFAHPNNPVPAGIAPLAAQFWQPIWLAIRLMVFVWIFTAQGASWSRWLTVITLAVLVFVLSTGSLNRIAEQVWRPIARHLESLLPALDRPNARRGGRGDQQGEARGEAPRQEADPAQMAARLLAERQGQDTWLMAQFRRLERAGLLFLASIAPGVAERHIENLEAEARAERARRETAEREAAEAAAAAEAEAAAANNAEDGAEGAVTENENESSEPRPTGDEGHDGEQREARGERDEAAREPLVAL